MKQKQYILYRYKINFVFIWVDFIKQGKIPCLFFSRDRTFSPPENGASSACLKASCLRSQPQAASVFDRRQQDAARFHMPQGKRSAGMAAVASRAASAGPALSNVPDGTRHFPQQADKTDAFYNRHWKPNGSPYAVHRCPCGNGVKGKVECRAPCAGARMLVRSSPFFTIFGARRCLPAVRGYPRRKANGFLCALTSNRAVQVGADCFPARARRCPSLQGRRRASSHGCLPVRDPVAGTAESMRRSGVSLRAGAQMSIYMAHHLGMSIVGLPTRGRADVHRWCPYR